jgi:oligo-1,6-glucosidase
MQQRTWWKEGVVYQIYPRSFKDSNHDGIGDLEGIREKLPYLKELGVDIIWLCPVYKSPNDDNGYDISDYDDIMDDFGTNADFDRLLHEAHESGIRIIMDLVVNHTSDEHPWFLESRKSKDNPKRDWYIWKEGKEGHTPPNNWGACFGGSAWQYDETTDAYYLHSFSRKQPDLNWENPDVRHAVYDMMNRWGKRGIDGFRMDVITMLSKDQRFPDGVQHGEFGDGSPYTKNGPRIHEFIREMEENVIRHYDWMTVGEGSGCGVEGALEYTGFDKHELDMVFSFEHMNLGKPQSHNGFQSTIFSWPAWMRIMEKWQQGLDGKGWNTLYLENHDQTRSATRYGDGTKESAKSIATLYFLMQGTPFIYEGQELGMTNYPFSNIDETRDLWARNDYHNLLHGGRTKEEAMAIIRQITRDNSRTPMQWDDSRYGGFSDHEPWIAVNPNTKSINVKAELSDPSSVFRYYQKLIALRKKSDILLYGHFTLIDPDNPNVCSYERSLEGKSIQVICNMTGNKEEFPDGMKDGEILLSTHGEQIGHLRPHEALVIACKN